MNGTRGLGLLAVTLLLLLASTALLVSVALRRLQGSPAETVTGESLYREVMARVAREHVDPIDAEATVYGAMKGLVSELDPHSRVFDPVEWAEFQRESRGEATGLGIELAIRAGALAIVAVVPGSPADLAGIRAGDRIVSVSGHSAAADRAAALAALTGPKGARIELVLSGGEPPVERRVDVVRDTFDVVTVRTRLLAPGIAYARISAFRPRTPEAFERALREAAPDGVKALVLDLRFNRGGSFDAAVKVADAWLARGSIVRTKGPVQEETREAASDAPLMDVPTVVLVNGSTASAAEVVAAALQDVHAAVLVGERTYGKGVVQEIVEFESWPGGMKLTTARMYSPCGRCIDRGMHPAGGAAGAWGILPDFVVDVPDADAADLERSLDFDEERDRPTAESRGPDSRPRTSDPQLDAAVALVRGEAPDAGFRAPDDAAPSRPR